MHPLRRKQNKAGGKRLKTGGGADPAEGVGGKASAAAAGVGRMTCVECAVVWPGWRRGHRAGAEKGRYDRREAEYNEAEYNTATAVVLM